MVFKIVAQVDFIDTEGTPPPKRRCDSNEFRFNDSGFSSMSPSTPSPFFASLSLASSSIPIPGSPSTPPLPGSPSTPPPFGEESFVHQHVSVGDIVGRGDYMIVYKTLEGVRKVFNAAQPNGRPFNVSKNVEWALQLRALLADSLVPFINSPDSDENIRNFSSMTMPFFEKGQFLSSLPLEAIAQKTTVVMEMYRQLAQSWVNNFNNKKPLFLCDIKPDNIVGTDRFSHGALIDFVDGRSPTGDVEEVFLNLATLFNPLTSVANRLDAQTARPIMGEIMTILAPLSGLDLYAGANDFYSRLNEYMTR